jgi:hypothetical protein
MLASLEQELATSDGNSEEAAKLRAFLLTYIADHSIDSAYRWFVCFIVGYCDGVEPGSDA